MIEDGKGPAAFKEFFRGGVIDGLVGVARLGSSGFKGKNVHSTAALLGAGPVEFVGKKVLQRTEQKRTEAAFGAIDGSERMLFEKRDEEGLDEVFRIRRGQPSSAGVGIERIPVGAGEVFEGPRGGGIAALGGENERPARGEKVGGSGAMSHVTGPGSISAGGAAGMGRRKMK